MATDVKKVRIFVASPGDVQLERDHLVKVVNELNLTISALSPEKRITLELVRWETHTYGEISAVRAQILNLANRYEEIRRTMPGGDDRTREMELLASRLRSLALPAYPLLDEFTRSESSGQRLAAVSILEAIPTPAYLPWLSERIVVERRFIVYHALIALLNAARNLGASNRAELQEAVHRARQNLDRMGWKDPNQIAVLENAEKELNWLAEAKR